MPLFCLLTLHLKIALHDKFLSKKNVTSIVYHVQETGLLTRMNKNIFIFNG